MGQVHEVDDDFVQLAVELVQITLAAMDDTGQVVGDIVEVGRAAIGREQGTPVQTAPVAMLRDEHVAERGHHVVGAAHEGYGERLHAVGAIDAVAVMAVAQRQASLVQVNQQGACLECGRITPHAGSAHAAHDGSLGRTHFLSGLGILKMRFQRMPPLNRPWSLSNEMRMMAGVPTMWSSGTKPQ